MSHACAVASPPGRQLLLDLLEAIGSAQRALAHWDAPAFEKAVAEQQRVCSLLAGTFLDPEDSDVRQLLIRVRAALRTYRIIIEKGTRWCTTLDRIYSQTAEGHPLGMRSERA